MIPAHVVEITTPKKFLLRGLWFGPKHPKRVIVFIHGLGGSAFSMRNVVDTLVDQDTAVLTFNNRGYEAITTLRKKYPLRSLRYGGGAAHEVFTECVDDIQGAINFVRRSGVRSVYLAGHSTGCQKSIYWAHVKKSRGIKGVILLGPIDDLSAELHRKGKNKIMKARAAAKKMYLQGKKRELIPSDLWHEVLDAQRFLSLYTEESVETMFLYALPKKSPRLLRSVKVPILVLMGEHDEYLDRPAKQVVEWFAKNIRHGNAVLVPKTNHGFRGKESLVASHLKRFIGR